MDENNSSSTSTRIRRIEEYEKFRSKCKHIKRLNKEERRRISKVISLFRYFYNKIGHSSRSSSIQRSKTTKEKKRLNKKRKKEKKKKRKKEKKKKRKKTDILKEKKQTEKLRTES